MRAVAVRRVGRLLVVSPVVYDSVLLAGWMGRDTPVFLLSLGSPPCCALCVHKGRPVRSFLVTHHLPEATRARTPCVYCSRNLLTLPVVRGMHYSLSIAAPSFK